MGIEKREGKGRCPWLWGVAAIGGRWLLVRSQIMEGTPCLPCNEGVGKKMRENHTKIEFKTQCDSNVKGARNKVGGISVK